MRVNGLDHVNIVTDKLAETARFYSEVLQLEERDPPPGLDPALVRWMFDREGRAIFHLSSPASLFVEDAGAMRSADTGAVHHVALDCTGHDALIERLDRLRLERRLNDIAAIGLKQIFVRDPNGVLLELNFRANH